MKELKWKYIILPLLIRMQLNDNKAYSSSKYISIPVSTCVMAALDSFILTAQM